ncbi:MAG: metallophosphoesterase family protein [Candidatus Delongbacteria bacterium]|nr:metallophosphoesterase family protein [Candidatus Delongbacteria bacterium]MBN2833964.1 metallophosphoesterase family protein [Candidatus Delongbacteria bacterium]
MKIAVISDIHSNLEALLSVIRKIEEEKVDRIYCLGDIVGYGPNPNECIELIKSVSDKVVLGNHDSAVLGYTSTALFNEYAKNATVWTRKNLSAENLDYLESLPIAIRENNLLFVHSTPYEPEKWNYILSTKSAADSFDYFEEDVCFIGHSHRNEVFRNGDGRLIINAGSVGQPRDGNPRACFCVFDTLIFEFKFFRVTYDIKSVYLKIKNSELDDFLGERLLIGK